MKHSMKLSLIALAFVTLTITAGCGGGSKVPAATAPTSRFTASETEEATPPIETTTTVDPIRVAMAQWAGGHIQDVDGVEDALTKMKITSGAISDALTTALDAYLANPAGGLSTVASDRATATHKQTCVELGTAVRTAQRGLPAPSPQFDASYSQALDHYLDASRACQLGMVEETTAQVTSASAAFADATSILAGLNS